VQSHPTSEKIKRFLEGKANPAQARVVVTHLLQGCSDCAATMESILRPKRELPPDAYDDAFDKAFFLIMAHLDMPRPLPAPTIGRGGLLLPGAPI
jgi:hypothetical protein